MASLPIILVALFAHGPVLRAPQAPPATRVSQAQAPTTPAQAARFLERLGSGGGPAPTSCSARVTMRDTDLLEVRPILPYTDAPPLSSIRVDFCAALETVFRMENWGVFSPLAVSVTPRAVRFDVSFDPNFDPAFEIVHVDFLVSPLGFVLAPFDGTLDFVGPSAATFPESLQLLGTANLAVDPNDAAAQAYFRSGAVIYFRTVSGAWSVSTAGGASYSDDTVTLAGGGSAFFWNQ